MKVMENRELEKQIHSFMERKTKQFPELQHIGTKRERTDLLTRVQDFVAVWPHATRPRHSH